MKKPIDLNSLVNSYDTLSEDSFRSLLKLFNFDIRNTEVEQIGQFIQNLDIEDKYFGYFYVGYKIPQIDKEFDLLRFGENYLLNIEIKSTLIVEDAKEQLTKNKYYLSLLGKKVKYFTYIVDENVLYQFDDSENFEQVEFNVLSRLLISQHIEHHTNIDDLFDPSNYLVSPFNETKRFIEGAYFLTKQQQEFKNTIMQNNSKVTIIEGLPGTGKTLLLYDLAKEVVSSKNVVIIHTGTLNTGHLSLNQQYGWNILPIRRLRELPSNEPEYIFVDETQRMDPGQLLLLIHYIESNDVAGFFSLDPRQVLSLKESRYDNKRLLLEMQGSTIYKLSKKIRTNKELAAFIKGLLSLNKMQYCNNTENISIHYFDKIDQARGFAEGLEEEGWQVIDYTGQNWHGEFIERMRLNRGLNAHQVLGQEFDKVLVLVGSSFYYSDDGRLSVRGSTYYDPERMFYQSVTRARKQLMLLVVDNPDYMNKLITSLIR